MTIRKRCNEWSCTMGRKCLDHLRFDVMWRGRRYRMPANDVAIPRMEPGKQRPIQSMEEARDAIQANSNRRPIASSTGTSPRSRRSWTRISSAA